MGVQGVSEYEREALILSSPPWRLFGDFLPEQKVTRRRGGEIPLQNSPKKGAPQ